MRQDFVFASCSSWRSVQRIGYLPSFLDPFVHPKEISWYVLVVLKITSLRDVSFTTRLGHNRIQNCAELIPLTEVYKSEIRRLRAENGFLKMQHNSIVIQRNAALVLVIKLS